MRSRWRYALLVALTIACGLTSRRPGWPEWVYLYVGDVLYATMFYFLMATLFPRRPLRTLAVLAISWCWTVEISQAIQWPWLVELRQTRMGGLVLGQVFLWSDMVCYVIGTILGILVDRSLQGGEDRR